MNTDFTKKIFILASVLIISSILILFVVLNLTRGSGNITINTVPGDAQIIVEDETYKSPAKLAKIKAGEHKVKISKEGYKTREEVVIVSKNQTSEVTFRLYTEVVTPTAVSASIQEARTSKSDLEKLIQFLPHRTYKFWVEALFRDGKTSVVITVHAIFNKPSQYENYKKQLKQRSKEALDWIRSKDVDSERLDIIWKPSDPFK